MTSLLPELANFTALHEKAMKSLVLHLVGRVGLVWFGVERIYDHGGALFLTTDSAVYRHHIEQGIPIYQYPFDEQVQNNVFEDVLVPKVNTTRRHEEEVKVFNHGCQAVFVIYSEGYHEVFRFSSKLATPRAIRAFIRNWHVLEAAVQDFLDEYQELLDCEKRAIMIDEKMPVNHYSPFGRLTTNFKTNDYIELPASEMRVLPHYALDKTHKGIAATLGITSNTSETYLERIRLKAGVRSRKDLKPIARANRLTLGFHKSSCRNS